MPDPLREHYEERLDPTLPAGCGRSPEVMVQRLELHRAYLPDIIFTNAGRAYSPERFNTLLDTLNSIREAHPRRFFYIYVEGSGEGVECDCIYLMASSDGGRL